MKAIHCRGRDCRFSYRIIHWMMVLGAAAILAFAFYLEQVQGLVPCPLCITQRVFFGLVGGVALLAALHNPVAVGRRVYAAFILLFSLVGGGVAARQLWLQQLPPEEVPACGPGVDYLLEVLPWHELAPIFFRGSGNCAEVAWTFLGLSIPGWSLLAFILMTAATWQAVRREPASRQP